MTQNILINALKNLQLFDIVFDQTMFAVLGQAMLTNEISFLFYENSIFQRCRKYNEIVNATTSY